MTKFIELPNGDLIHPEAIRVIRLGDPLPEGKAAWESELKPRVIIDFIVGAHDNCIVLDCDTVKQRDDLAANLKAQVNQTLPADRVASGS